MAIFDDFTINYAAKTITHTAGTTVYTANALYSWLMDTFDELQQMDDPVPMSAQTPTDYSFINGWTWGDPVVDPQFINGGAITDTATDTVWVNVYTDGSIVAGSQVYIEQNGAVLPSFWPAGHVDILVKVKDNGVFIDSGLLTFYIRESGDMYAHTQITATSGRRVGFLQTENDRNDDGTGGAVTGITINYTGPFSADIDGNGATNYDTQIDCGGNTLLDTYMYLKDLVKRGSTTLVDGVEGQMYKSALTGYTEITKAPFGEYAGGKFFGARGILLINMAGSDANNYELTDSAGATKVPPTTVALTIDKLVAGDRVSAFRLDAPGGAIIKNEYTLSGAHLTGSTTITVVEAIKPDTPASGYIRVNGELLTYTAVDTATSTFTVSATTVDHADLDPCYVPFIDTTATGTSVSNTFQYAADVPVLIRVRIKGIQPFEIETTVGNTGQTVSAIRTPDTIVV